MPRTARLKIADLPLHVIQRGVDRQLIFHCDGDYRFYLALLARFSAPTKCAVHAFALMGNHVHLLISSSVSDGASLFMKQVGQRFARFINDRYERTGPLFEGRFRSCIVDSEGYLLRCQRYIELNPVRAGLVLHPRDYPWSSYRFNAEGETSTFLSAHAAYRALGTDGTERRGSYKALFDELESELELGRIRAAVNSGLVLGREEYREAFERSFGKKATQQARGPKKRREIPTMSIS